MRYLLTFAIVLNLVCVGLQAQEGAPAASQPEKLKTEISIVALGPKPTRKYKQVDGGDSPIMLLAKPGETPPPRLYFKGKSADGKTTWLAFNVPFNNPSSMRAIAPEKELNLFKKLPGKDNYERYVTIPPGKEGSRRIFFLSPAVTGPTPWNESPRIRMITITAESMQGKQFILKNLSRFTVLHAFEDNVVSVAPMQTISYKRAKTGQLYRLAARYGTQKKIIYNTAVRLNGEGHIQLYALYDANPKTNANRSVGVFRMMIPARNPPQPN